MALRRVRSRCAEDKSRHVGPSESCFDPKDFVCKTCGGLESAHARSGSGKMYCSNWFGLEAALKCTHCSKDAASHHGAGPRKFCEPEEAHRCALCGKAGKEHHGAGKACAGEEEAFVAAQLFTVDHLRDAPAFRADSRGASREGGPTPHRLPGQVRRSERDQAMVPWLGRVPLGWWVKCGGRVRPGPQRFLNAAPSAFHSPSEGPQCRSGPGFQQ